MSSVHRLAAAALAAALLPAAGAAAADPPPPPRSPAATPPGAAGGVQAVRGKETRKAVRRSSKRTRVRARTSAGLTWSFNSRADCYSRQIAVIPADNVFGVRSYEPARYRSFIQYWTAVGGWKLVYHSWIDFRGTLSAGSGATVGGNHVTQLPYQTFSAAPSTYARAGIEVYYPQRGYSDWNWVPTAPVFLSGGWQWGYHCVTPA